MRFLKENWIWIVAPAVVFVILIAVLYWLSSDSSAPMMYNFR